ncbi:ArdC family protein [Candidatus Cryosericum septentrionale]|jgi:antirestriction protein ArdC|uniref:N-terminal domain-containing protein n=1 Tax=Candidatus Cryosericum septentrionale TaxID=2290913 RepID=A0A398DUB4_9BACT|nr:ArdC family protein [Candidatus Cryosericum septentrionale]RIE17699.1 hypothetical protein SMC1_00505 [Candidatus Cryosericum septentrionale]
MEATRNRIRERRKRVNHAERAAMQTAALGRAREGRTCTNDLLIIAAYAAKGIDAHPRIDVFTFNAWKALHRHVRKGEHGIHVAIYAHKDTVKSDGTTEEQSFPVSAVVFHVTQTDPDTENVTA